MSGDESDVPKSPPPRTGTWGSRRTARRSRGHPASQPRLLPQHRCHVGRLWRWIGTRPRAVVQVIWRVHRGSRATSGVGRKLGQAARELDFRFWKGARSRPSDAACHHRGDERLHQSLCAWFAQEPHFKRSGAKRDGANGMQNGQPAHVQSSLRVYPRNQYAHDSRRPGNVSAHHQRPCEPWLFVLRKQRRTTVPEPRQLGLNGSFAVFKKVETDVVGFEDFLQSNKDKIDPELVAAKMLGRWRNGVPLALSLDLDRPGGGIPPES